MSVPVIYCDLDQLRAAGARYVEEGVQDMRFKAERQRDVDGALVFLQSEAAKKLQPDAMQPKVPAAHEPARTVLGIQAERARG